VVLYYERWSARRPVSLGPMTAVHGPIASSRLRRRSAPQAASRWRA